jgi:hypothetical protein
MKNLFKGFICFFVLCLALPVLAGSIKSYSADMVDVKSGKVMQRIAAAPDKLYMENFNSQGKREGVAIIRLDQRKMYIFMEETKTYMEMPFDKDRFSLADMQMGGVETKDEALGTEKVSGYTATRHRQTTKVMGVTTTALYWLAPEFDPMPVRAEVAGAIQEMRNIKTGSPDAALFEIPKGYKRDKTMEDMMKGMISQGK